MIFLDNETNAHSIRLLHVLRTTDERSAQFSYRVDVELRYRRRREFCLRALLESAVRDNPMEIAEEFHSIDERSIWRGSIVIDQEQFERGSNPKFRTHNQALRRIFSPFAVDREAPNSDCFVLEPLAIERLH